MVEQDRRITTGSTVVVLQHGLVEDARTRAVAAMFPDDGQLRKARFLNPVFEVDGDA